MIKSLQKSHNNYSFKNQKYWCHVCRHQKNQMINTEIQQEINCGQCHSPMEIIQEHNHPSQFTMYQADHSQHPTHHQTHPQATFIFTHPMFFFDISNIFNTQKEPEKTGTSKEKLEQLEEQTIKNDKSDKQCSICLENYKKDEKILLLPCDHIFHKDCILNWVKDNQTCPCCRSKI